MGTRNLTMVQLDGKYRIAQYGQFDGYPAGQGQIVLDFLKTWDRPRFEKKLRAASFYTPVELEALEKTIKSGESEQWFKARPHLSVSIGAEILKLVQEAKAGIKLKSEEAFAGDSVFCEYAYVIDLDANRLEVYKGFNQTPLSAEARFAKLPVPDRENTYFPIRLVASYKLNRLPSLAKMSKDVDPDREK